jgi:hypothetical protein
MRHILIIQIYSIERKRIISREIKLTNCHDLITQVTFVVLTNIQDHTVKYGAKSHPRNCEEFELKTVAPRGAQDDYHSASSSGHQANGHHKTLATDSGIHMPSTYANAFIALPPLVAPAKDEPKTVPRPMLAP